MKFIYKGIGLISILFIVASCSFSKKQTMNKAEANDSCKIEVVVLDPGHFHASLLQKDALAVINDTIRIYAPEGIGVNQYLESIDLTTIGQSLPLHGRNRYIQAKIISRKCFQIIKVMS